MLRQPAPLVERRGKKGEPEAGAGPLAPTQAQAHSRGMSGASIVLPLLLQLASPTPAAAAQGRTPAVDAADIDQTAENDDAVQAVVASGSKRRILAELQRMADGGNAAAAWQLGVFLDTGGHGITPNPDRAFRLFELAAAQGESRADVSLGLMHATGRGTPVDYAASMRSYRAGADAGNAHGYYGIGVLYALGQGVAQDGKEALVHFMVAAALQDRDALRPVQALMRSMSPSNLPDVVSRANSILDTAGRSERVVLDGDRVLFRMRATDR